MANFNRRHYIAVAEVLRVHTKRAQNLEQPNDSEARVGALRTMREVSQEFADTFARDNYRFDRDHFLAVVRGEKDLNSRPSKK